MSRYLLPCSCGKSSSVSAAQAGETIDCSCGKRIEVPTLRGLRDLERVEPDAQARRASGRAWEDRHRVAFLLLLVVVGALATAGYLAMQLSKAPVFVSAGDVEAELRDGRVEQVMGVYEQLKQGLTAGPTLESTEDKRRLLLWGMGIAGGVALAALGGAGVALASGRRRHT